MRSSSGRFSTQSLSTIASPVLLPHDFPSLVREDIWVLSLLGVLPGQQDTGVGRRLLEAAVDYGRHARVGLILTSRDPRAARRYAMSAVIQRASASYFGKPAMFAGLGGSIPFMSMLGERFPQAQFLITGAMGPGSNAHGPNEFLHLPTGARVTACVAEVVGDHSDRSRR